MNAFQKFLAVTYLDATIYLSLGLPVAVLLHKCSDVSLTAALIIIAVSTIAAGTTYTLGTSYAARLDEENENK